MTKPKYTAEELERLRTQQRQRKQHRYLEERLRRAELQEAQWHATVAQLRAEVRHMAYREQSAS